MEITPANLPTRILMDRQPPKGAKDFNCPPARGGMHNLGTPANIEPIAKPFVKWAGGKRGIIVKLLQRVSRMGGGRRGLL